MDKPNILLHTHAMTPGGAERQLALLARGLASHGWNIHIVTLYRGGHFWEELKKDNVCTLHSLDRKGSLDFGVVRKLARYIKEHNIDLVQGWMPVSNVFASVAAKWSGVPALTAVRASQMNNPLGGRLYEAADRLLASRLSAATVFNSHAGMQHYFGHTDTTGKLKVIPNGLEFPANRSFSKPLQNHQIRIGMVARLDPMKDHVTAFNALKKLLDEDECYELHLYGDGTDEWKDYLKAKAQELGVLDHIYWHGFTKDIWPVFSGLDIIVSSSLGEGMPNTILEAMGAKRPIVATDVGDTRLLLGSNNQRGVLIPVEDDNILATAILKLVSHPSMAIEMGENAANHVKQEYSVDTMVDTYERLYQTKIKS